MLLFKLLLVPCLVATVSLAGQKLGPTIAGLLTGLPIVAGPIFVLLTLEQGTEFGIQAASTTLLGLVAFAGFNISYGWSCRTRKWPFSLLIGLLTFFALSGILSQLSLPLWAIWMLAAAVPTLGPFCFPQVQPSTTRSPLPRIELAFRMLTAGLLVLALTQAATVTGPKIAGLLTPFPIAASVLAVFSHRQGGPLVAIPLLRGVVVGLFGFVAFFTAISLLLPNSTIQFSVGSAIAASMLAQTAAFRIATKRNP